MLLLFCRVLYICFLLCGEGKCETAVEDPSVLWQIQTSRELRLELFSIYTSFEYHLVPSIECTHNLFPQTM